MHSQITEQVRILLEEHRRTGIARGVADHRDFADSGRQHYDDRLAAIEGQILYLVDRLAAQLRPGIGASECL